MDEQPLSNPPAMHPPMMPGINAAPRSVWPSVLGIVAMVFGVLGTLQGGLGLLAPIFLGRFRTFVSSTAQGADPLAGFDQHKTEMTISALLTIAAGTWLVAGAILLVQRMRAARIVLLSWAAIKMGVVVFGAWLGYIMNQAQFAAMQQSGTVPPGMTGMMGVMSAVGAVIGIAWGWCLPIFMIIWFMRPKVRRDIATW